jgi:hypothetical protein
MRRMLKRRAAIEPTIGHLKSDNRMNRNYLTGREGDKINAVLASAGYNFGKLLRWLVFTPISWRWCRLVAKWAIQLGLRPAPNRVARAGFRPVVI